MTCTHFFFILFYFVPPFVLLLKHYFDLKYLFISEYFRQTAKAELRAETVNTNRLR